MQPNLSLALNLPPEGALRYFDSLNLPLPANASEAVAQAATKARSIAGIYQQEIVGDLLNSLRQSAAEGTPFATWRKNMLTMLRERGLALDKAGDMVQQSTGEVVGTGLTRHRLQTIFQTQMTNARMASLWQKLQENKDAPICNTAPLTMRARAPRIGRWIMWCIRLTTPFGIIFTHPTAFAAAAM